MLAKDLKIASLMKQRNYIETLLKAQVDSFECSVCLSYVGQIYKENKEYFEKQGFSVIRVDYSSVMANTNGVPAYVISINESAFNIKPEEYMTKN